MRGGGSERGREEEERRGERGEEWGDSVVKGNIREEEEREKREREGE